MFESNEKMSKFKYSWNVSNAIGPKQLNDHLETELVFNEKKEALSADSRWPVFFPSPIGFIATHDEQGIVFEKVVGPTIVNRFPYIAMVSLCKEELSKKHYSRKRFLDAVARGSGVSIQFVPPGPRLERLLYIVNEVETEKRSQALTDSGFEFHSINGIPFLQESYLSYCGEPAKPQFDYSGTPIFKSHDLSVGSHTLLFLEIKTILLDEGIAAGKSQVWWQSLPSWNNQTTPIMPKSAVDGDRIKGFTSNYKFPSAGTVGFSGDYIKWGKAIKELKPLDLKLGIDNDNARWPCFFPSSLGLITMESENGQPNLMPCGSTAMVSRFPMIIAPCVSYAKINDRYAPRASLDLIRKSGKFGCGVGFVDPALEEAIRYCGNTSISTDPEKALKSGLTWVKEPSGNFRAKEFPIYFDCKVVGEISLGTHVMFLGQIQKAIINPALAGESKLVWYPFADIV